MTDPTQLRVGHREREKVMEVLHEATEEGRLTLEELDERLDGALVAKTYADLDLLVADLPIDRPSTALQQPVPQLPPEIGTHADDPLRVSGGMWSDTRSGEWRVPPFLVLSGDMGSVKLNCLEAICPHEIVDIDVSGGMGSITIVVPDGWGASTERVTKGWGGLSNKVDPLAQPGHPLLVLHGNAGMGSITVRYASWFDRRGLEKSRSRREERSRQLAGEWVERPRELPRGDDLR